MAIIFVLVGLTTFLFYLWTKRHFRYWSRNGMSQISGSFPFGSLYGVGFQMCNTEKYDCFYRRFKGKESIVGFYNFMSPAVLLIGPDAIKTALVREFSSFHSRGMFYNSKDDPISENLLTLEGSEWKNRRAKLTPMFTTGKIKMMFEIIEKIGDEFVDVLLNEIGDLDMRIWAQRYTNDVIGKTAFGFELSCLKNKESDFLKYGKRCAEKKSYEVLQFLFSSEFPDLARKLGFRFFPKESGDFFLNTFTETLKYREENKIDRNDFVSLLLKMKETYTTTELAAEAFLIYAAGYETSSSLIAYTLYELALNQDIQERLREEIMSGNDGKLTYDVVCGFKYLDMTVNEALRKYPPLPYIARKCYADFKFTDGNFSIPKGASLVINSYSLHRDPEYFPNPDKFDPERFSDENKRNIKPFTFLPFGEGPRSCIGIRFGEMQSKIAISKLIQNFKFSPCQKTSIPIKFNPKSPFIEPEGGMWLNIEKHR